MTAFANEAGQMGLLAPRQVEEEILVTKTQVEESPHPYSNNMDTRKRISFPQARELRIIFDPQSEVSDPAAAACSCCYHDCNALVMMMSVGSDRGRE